MAGAVEPRGHCAQAIAIYNNWKKETLHESLDQAAG